MFFNYFKIAWRNILRNKVYSAINIVGLAIGICSCVLIFIYIQDELSFDKHWKNADRIVRVNQVFIDGGVVDPYAATSFHMAPSLKENLPEIESIVRISPNNNQAVSYENKYFNEDRQYTVDANFFDVFNFELLKGDPETCLKEPNSVVISEDMANRFFGSSDPMGKMLQYPRKLYKVTGVLKSTHLESHLRPNALLSVKSWNKKPQTKTLDWFSLSVFTYVKLKNALSIKIFDQKLKLWSEKFLDPAVKENKFSFKTELKSLLISDIYFDKFYAFDQFEKGEKNYLSIFGWVAAFLLIIACFNYMNLTTARALKRSKEVGLRKVVGAERGQLIFQFLAESLVVTTVAIAFSMLLTVVLLPAFNSLTVKNIHLTMLLRNGGFWIALICMILFISLIGGSYPAFYLSNFRPAEVLKGKLVEIKSVSLFSKIRLRQLLVVGQFTISTVIIIATIMVYKQLILMKNKDLGFNKDQVVVLKFPSYMDSTEFNKIEPFKTELLKNSSILNFATTENFVGSARNDYFFRSKEKIYSATLNSNWGDYNYLDLLNIKLVEGRNFSKDLKDDFNNFIINESAVKFLGWVDPLGKEMSSDNGTHFGKVIGVMKDYNYKSPHTKVEPLAIALPQERNATGSIVLIKIAPVNIPKSLNVIDQKWNEFFPKNPIARFFLDEKFNEQYNKDQTMLTLFTCFSGLTILISCLGLLGLASYTTEQRIKEIGIRKVLGATITNITYLISKDFIFLIIIAIILAAPVAYYFISSWLQDFAYRTEVNPWVFIMSGSLALLVAFLSLSFQTIKAAIANPIKSLRTE